jgi:transmembrane sensor
MIRLTQEELRELVRRKLNGTITEQENALLEAWYEQQPEGQVYWDSHDGDEKALHDRVFKAIREKAGMDTPARPVRLLRRSWLRYAAAVLLLCGAAVYGYFHITRPAQPLVAKTPAATSPEVIRSGQGGVMLTLADGTRLPLDSLGNGQLTAGSGVNAVLQGNQLTYDNARNASPGTYNTLSTPRGAQFRLVLPDGSRVWLNAASSIRYPTAFTGNERAVSINGEAYFEIAENEQMPFSVNAGDRAAVRVLGTHFNVKGYEDEERITVTLLEGAVKVQRLKAAVADAAVMKPGQQAQLPMDSLAADPIRITDSGNTAAVMAWKNGMFSFNGAGIRTIMGELARWYNVNVIYTGNIQERFHIEVSRNMPVSDILKILEGTGKVRFRVEGQQITVMP